MNFSWKTTANVDTKASSTSKSLPSLSPIDLVPQPRPTYKFKNSGAERDTFSSVMGKTKREWKIETIVCTLHQPTSRIPDYHLILNSYQMCPTVSKLPFLYSCYFLCHWDYIWLLHWWLCFSLEYQPPPSTFGSQNLVSQFFYRTSWVCMTAPYCCVYYVPQSLCSFKLGVD